MKRTVAIAACGFSLAGCSGMPGMPSFSFGSPPATTIQFESEPPGAEATTSTGQTCRTPCAQAIAANEFTVTFTLNGYQSQTVPVRISDSTEPVDPNTGAAPAPRMVPNPVFVELQRTPPPPPPRRRTTPPRRQQPAATAPRPAAPAPAQQQKPAPAAPAPAPAAAWPPPPGSSSPPASSSPPTAWPPPPQR